MTIDPRWSIGLAVLLAALNYIAGASALLTDAGADPSFVKKLIAVIALTNGLLTSVLAVLTGIPSKDNTTGFLIKGPPKNP